MISKIDIRNKSRYGIINKDIKGSYIFIGPKGNNDRNLFKYSGYISFRNDGDLKNFAKTFRNEEELIRWFYNRYYNGIYDLIGDRLSDTMTVLAYDSYMKKVKLEYSYEKEKSTKIKIKMPKIRFLRKARKDDKWGNGAVSSSYYED